MTPRILIASLLIAVLGLSACGSDRSALPGAIFGSLKNALSRNKQPPLTTEILRARLTPEVRAQFGVPILIAEVPKQKVAAVVFYVTQNADTITWNAGDGVGIYTRKGILTGSRGVGYDLMAADVSGPLSVILGKGNGIATRTHKYLDGENREVAIRFDCTYVRTGAVVTESCETKGLAIENTYVLNKKGEIQASRQWMGARNGYMLLEAPIF